MESRTFDEILYDRLNNSINHIKSRSPGLFSLYEQLKKLKRKAWIRYSVDEVSLISGYCYIQHKFISNTYTFKKVSYEDVEKTLFLYDCKDALEAIDLFCNHFTFSE